MRPDFPRAVDSSMRKSFTACPMKAYYEYFLKIRAKGGSIHLHFGGAFAYGLEIVRKSFYEFGKSEEEALSDGIHAIITFWGDFVPPEDSKKTLETCILALADYFDQYPLASDSVQPYIVDGKPAIEFTFALPIPGTKHPQTGEPILYYGRFDMLGRYRNACFIVDEKTSGQLGKGWANSYRLASQITGYVWAAKSFGFQIEGAIIRGVAPLTYQTNFVQLIEQRPQWMIDRWMAQLHRDVKHMIECWESGIFDYSIDEACGAYGGCSYMPLCSSRQPEKWIDTHYEVHNWNPLDKFSENQEEYQR